MTHNEDIAALIRTIPDFPKPGIQFRDITTLLLDGRGLAATIARLASLMTGRSIWSRRSRRAASSSARRWRMRSASGWC